MKTVQEILAADLDKNYPKKAITAQQYYDGLMDALRGKYKLYREDNTLFLTHDVDDGVEFHAMNGDRADSLVKNCNAFFDKMSEKGYKYAVTYYDNPKITTLLVHSKYPYESEKIDDGEYRTYKFLVRLSWAQ
jgi:hypothetical protein